LNKGLKLETQERALTLETSDELASIYKVEALKGDSRVPKNPEDEVFYHYICFVPSEADSRVYELDGDRTGPIKTEVVLGSDENMLSEKALGLVRAYIDRKGVQDIGFNLMALTQR
jgi:ubiquitin carboxyl-terminal hydrolase L3